MSPRQTVYDEAGRAWQLDRQLAAGGEGFVHTLAAEETVLAKLYKGRPSPQSVEKLRWMVRASSADLRRVSAWPIALLHDRPGGQVVGFFMPRVVGYEPIHHLYNPGQRWKYFPRADWSFLAHAARNCAAAFDEVHRADCLVADINQSNLLVSSKALIALIDCDSFQVHAGGSWFLCEVGVVHYTAPELQGLKDAFKRPRTANHDRFGLAVLLFQLLFMGRYPYAGRYTGTGELPFEQAIKEFRFAYAASPNGMQMERPPGTPPLSIVGPELSRLFERAFLRGSDAQNARPSAREWLEALDRFQGSLRQCPNDPGHKTATWGQSLCVWCAILNDGGPDYFKGVAAVATVFVLDRSRLADLRARVEKVTLADAPYNRMRLAPQPPPTPVPLPPVLVSLPRLAELPPMARPVPDPLPPRPTVRPISDWLSAEPPLPSPTPKPVVCVPPPPAARPISDWLKTPLPDLTPAVQPVLEALPPPPGPRPLSDWLPANSPVPPPAPKPVLSEPSDHLNEDRLFSRILAALNFIALVLVLLGLWAHRLAYIPAAVLIIIFPIWLIQHWLYVRKYRQDEQLRHKQFQHRMRAWKKTEAERQRRLQEVRDEAERQQQTDLQLRHRAWEIKRQQVIEKYDEEMRAWQEEEARRLRHVQELQAAARHQTFDLQQRTHVWEMDKQRAVEKYEEEMRAWQEMEDQRQRRLDERRKAAAAAERQQHLEFEPRLRAWEEASRRMQEAFEVRLRTWAEAEKQRQHQIHAQEQMLNEFERRRREERELRRQALERAEAALRDLEQQHQKTRDDWYMHRRESRRELEQVQQQCENLEAEYQEDRRRLEQNREALAREQYLRTTFLVDHDIALLGQGRLQILESHGIASAYDVEVHRILGISGFGPVLTRNLLEWKQRVVDDFRFDPRRGVPEPDLRSLALRYKQRQDPLLSELGRGAAALESQGENMRQQLQVIEAQLRPLVAEWAQARANLEVFH
jgi:DNA-binding helix-hairpin-helix protein with protein kinase domain